MKKIALAILLFTAMQAQAQVKSIRQLTSVCKGNFGTVAASLGSYWKMVEEGKLDTITYNHWDPAIITPANSGELVMCYYSRKDVPLNYLVFQTVDKAYSDRLLAGMLKDGYKLVHTEKIPDGKKDYYTDGKYNISLMVGKEDPAEPLLYVFGIRLVPKGKHLPVVVPQPKK